MQQLDPRTLLVDLNVRHTEAVGADLVASVAEHGVLVPIVAVRTEDGGVRVRIGHRRTLAAIEVGSATVLVVVVADEATDDAGTVHRLVPQWAENEHRAGLTNAERVDVIGQLSAFGISPTQIARRTRASKAEVTAALAVTASEMARKATARYEFLDLAQAATVAEFDTDPDAVQALVVAARGVGSTTAPSGSVTTATATVTAPEPQPTAPEPPTSCARPACGSSTPPPTPTRRCRCTGWSTPMGRARARRARRVPGPRRLHRRPVRLGRPRGPARHRRPG